jgi:hypothetical protein
MEEKGNVYNILVGEYKEKKLLERPECRRKDSFTTYIKEWGRRVQYPTGSLIFFLRHHV